MLKLNVLLACAAVTALSGCGAVTTAIEHRNLDVENKMTDTVFLEPISPSQQTIFLQIRNTTDQQDFDIASSIRSALEAKGYQIYSDPAQAHYLLQVNVLQVGKMDKNAMNQFFASGYGSAASVIGATAYGAGIGAMAAPWDTRINRLQLHVPTFGHQALRLTLPCVGSNEAVREYQQRHGNVMETLAYYDAATAARYLQIPTMVAAALFDPAVPPPGQFAVYNAIAEPLRRLFVLEAGHFDYPGQDARLEDLNRTLAAFLMEPSSDKEDGSASHAPRVSPLVQPAPAAGNGIARFRP